VRNKKIIIFRADNIGDFLFSTSLLKGIKNSYPESTITMVCSERNAKIARLYNIIDNIIIFERSYNLIKKFKLYWEILVQKYYAAFAIDGKKFSILNVILMRSKFKFLIKYRKVKKILGINIKFHRPWNLIDKLFFTNSQTFYSSDPDSSVSHMPTLYLTLLKGFNVNVSTKDPYFFPHDEKINDTFKKFYTTEINEKYILLHLDEKWIDIDFQNGDFFKEIINLQKKTNKLLIITSYKNEFQYYKNIKSRLTIFKFDENNTYKKENSNLDYKIHLVENLSLSFFERLICNSELTISCHTAYVTQLSACNNTKNIDLINLNRNEWYNCWVPKNIIYHRVYKDKLDKLFKNIIIKANLIL
jgi:ADP-heptose:LPS heptosyltransferase